MTDRAPQLPRLQRRMEVGHTMVSITSLRYMHRLLWMVIGLQVMNLIIGVVK
jgi:hypothetical protein